MRFILEVFKFICGGLFAVNMIVWTQVWFAKFIILPSTPTYNKAEVYENYFVGKTGKRL